jgi:hypothetical protein
VTISGWAIFLGTVVLAVALAYGLAMWSRLPTNPAIEEVRI